MSDARITPWGQERRIGRSPITSGLPRQADVFGGRRDVSKVPAGTGHLTQFEMREAVKRDGLSHFNRHLISSQGRLSIAPHDIYGVLFAVMPAGNRDGLRGAARHIWASRRCDNRRISMGPIPGNIISMRGTDIAWYGLRAISQGFAIRWPGEEVPFCRPEDPYIVSPVMPERSGDRRMGNRMRRSKPSAMRGSRPG
jgi:hypothetical protein